MNQRLICFKKILAALPLPHEIPAELLVISAGRDKGSWSYKHIFMDGETQYFIFRKAGWTDGLETAWESVDHQLNALMKQNSDH